MQMNKYACIFHTLHKKYLLNSRFLIDLLEIESLFLCNIKIKEVYSIQEIV